MLSLVQFVITVFAIYSAFQLPDTLRLFVPLGCLILMFIVNRLDRRRSDKETARKNFLRCETEKIWKKENSTNKEQDFFTIESLLWPRNELLLIDAVHFILKDLAFKVTTGINYHTVDRTVKIPGTEVALGLEILMNEAEAGLNHPKIRRALQFEMEKREKEKTLIIASTHIRLPLSQRGRVKDVSKELHDFLTRRRISLITAFQLYHLWQKAKGGEIDIYTTFQEIYSHPGGFFPLIGMPQTHPFLH